MKREQTIRRWWESIRIRMMAMLLLVNVIIIGILSAGAYSIYQDSFIRELAGSRTDVLRQIAERSRQFKTSLYTLSNLFESNPGFRMYSAALNEDNEQEFFTLMDATTRQLKESFIQPDLDFYVVYVSASGIGYCSRAVPQGYDYMDPRLKVWNRHVVEANGDIVDVGSYRDRSLGTASFSAARAILDDDNIVGFLMINADERQLYQMYEDVIRDGSNIYITNDVGQIISSSRGELIGFNYYNMGNLEQLFENDDYIITQAEGVPVLFTRYYDAESGFTIFEEAPLAQVLQPLRNIRRVVITFAVLCLLGGKVIHHAETARMNFSKELFAQNYQAALAIKDEILNKIIQQRPTDLDSIKKLWISFSTILLHFSTEQQELDCKVEQSEEAIRSAQTIRELKTAIEAVFEPFYRSIAQNGHYSPAVGDAITYLKNHYHEKISLAMVAQAVNFNPEYFSRLFVRETGMNFSAYLNSLRMRQAVELLERTDKKVYEIAEEVGYSSLSYFSTAFKKSFGQTPAEYQALKQKNK